MSSRNFEPGADSFDLALGFGRVVATEHPERSEPRLATSFPVESDSSPGYDGTGPAGDANPEADHHDRIQARKAVGNLGV